ncbi:glycosyl hydrolase family 18 [Leptospira semungkisensis]|uniref:Glycosyl hydrolase family 18 n=1 Tax=Leptospira semungkisensis TaxID=2484985 RepID=A0A4R9G730_9LEPT|nr:glycosyl hydrolase family 18 protein [Leptospira semungkisensis]TGK07035.1 glycosyl hydrolase family 18 [Leptospira semungkisensis]
MNIFPMTRVCFTILALISLCPLSAEENGVWKYALGKDLHSKPDKFWEKEFQQGTTICFTGTSISSDSKIQHHAPPTELLVNGNKKGVRWFPLISFSSPKIGEMIFSSPTQRRELIRHLEKFLDQYPIYKGIHLDFEGMPPSAGPHYKDFLVQLHPKIQQKKRILSLALFPQENFIPELAQFHSFVYRQNLADEVVLMAYDYHSPKTKPGPVTDYTWMQKNMNLLLKTYRSDQVWLGIPLYGYFWEKDKDSPRVLTYYKDGKFALDNGKEKQGIYLIRTKTGEGSLILDTSLWSEYAKNLKLRGLAFWRLGF